MKRTNDTPTAASPGAAPISPTAAAATRPFYWSLRRELWESRSIYLAPLAVAGLFLFGFLVSLIQLPEKMRTALALDAMARQASIAQPFEFAALAIMATTFLVAMLYCLDALHGERSDRSILFWKSLPVSDRTTVLAKASVAIVVIPLLTFVITVATQAVMLLLGSLVLVGSGPGLAAFWGGVSILATWRMLLYHLLAVHGLWYAPIFAWLLVVSAWARRAPFLWASLPLLAVCIFEKLAFDTTHFVALLEYRISGGAEAVLSSARGMPQNPGMDSVANPMMEMASGPALTNPGLWTGLALAGILLAGAIRLRRTRV